MIDRTLGPIRSDLTPVEGQYRDCPNSGCIDGWIECDGEFPWSAPVTRECPECRGAGMVKISTPEESEDEEIEARS